MPSKNLISLTSASNLRLEQFRTQYELAKNFYDDHEFCPIFHVEEVSEHRERIQKRTSPNSSVSSSSSTSSSYYVTSKQQQQQQQQHYYQQPLSKSNSTSAINATATRAIPIIDPSNMTPVAVPMHQQYLQKANTSPSMAQWVAYKNTTSPISTSPNSVHSSLSSSSSHSSSGSCSNNTAEYYQNYYFGNSNNCGNYQHQMIPTPTVIRAIPIIDPTTRQVFHQQQQQQQQQHIHHHQQQQIIPPPGFYNVSVC